ncbi:DNA mismatch repair protein MutS [Labrys sp. WJW]|uniref:MutS-related protein n=1 Tax=Labrys sp. WJW TaxID=1737983 RepID=UPI000830BA02|nr:DNA mismatch repair protein MutS [Labrys sp. WJW]OCC05455.1 DNA mismatch repair protein MutS [Labrys sp. WJW]
MKAFLMYRERDFDPKQCLPPNAAAVVQDLELETLFAAMAQKDSFVHDIVKVAVLAAANNTIAEISYRQAILLDSLKNPTVIRNLYDLAVEAIEREKKAYWGLFRDSPDTVLQRSIGVMQIFMDVLRRLRDIAEIHEQCFDSEGFRALFGMLQRELSNDYFAEVNTHLRQLKFNQGVWVSAHLGEANKGVDYVLREQHEDTRNWFMRLFPRKVQGFTLHLHPRDEAGARAMSDLKQRGIALAATAIGQAADHILSFFHMMRTELAFYVGALNLSEKLTALSAPTAVPEACPAEPPDFRCHDLYDVCLALSMGRAAVGNDLAANGKRLVMITGANQGGKSTFLRSVGLAQLMMQAGLFVAGRSLRASIVDGVFTHYKREEDACMRSGKFDEELNRMSDLVDILTPHALVLFNESFAATNEREGSEIARQISCALLDRGIRICFVTHLYEFAHQMHEMNSSEALFLRAERKDGGGRTFKLIEGEPLDTSFGEDLYDSIFQTSQNRTGPSPKRSAA